MCDLGRKRLWHAYLYGAATILVGTLSCCAHGLTPWRWTIADLLPAAVVGVMWIVNITWLRCIPFQSRLSAGLCLSFGFIVGFAQNNRLAFEEPHVVLARWLIWMLGGGLLFACTTHAAAWSIGWWQRQRRRRRVLSGACACCGYDLTGNVSGICPECGASATSEQDNGKEK